MTPCARDGSRGLLDHTTKLPGLVLEDKREDVETGLLGVGDLAVLSRASLGNEGST